MLCQSFNVEIVLKVISVGTPAIRHIHVTISMPKHSSPAKVIITNSPVNNTATQLEKNAWKNNGEGSATDCGRCGPSPSVGLVMASE